MVSSALSLGRRRHSSLCKWLAVGDAPIVRHLHTSLIRPNGLVCPMITLSVWNAQLYVVWFETANESVVKAIVAPEGDAR